MTFRLRLWSTQTRSVAGMPRDVIGDDLHFRELKRIGSSSVFDTRIEKGYARMNCEEPLGLLTTP